MEEDSRSILFQISSFKDMLDRVNEEIEVNIQKTRCIESEIVKCSEIEKGYLTRESELAKTVFVREIELNGLLLVHATTRRSLEVMEMELSSAKLDMGKIEKRTHQKREEFIIKCKQFQEDIVRGETTELRTLLNEKEILEDEKQKLISKLDALKSSTAGFIEDTLVELHNATLALQVEIRQSYSENENVLRDIRELKAILVKLV